MPRRGRELEKLVQALESAMAGKSVKIESPKRLRDKAAKISREFDVLMTIKESHHEVIVAFECKDWKKPVDVPEVEAFCLKCEDSNIDKRVIVSAKGFTDAAMEKARSRNIRCLSLETARKFDWFQMDSMVQTIPTLENINHCVFLKANAVPDLQDLEFVDKSGQRANVESFLKSMNIALQKEVKALSHPGVAEGVYNHAIKFNVSEVKAVHRKTQKEYEVNCVISKFTLKIEQRRIPFALHTYSEQDGKKLLTESAIAPIDAGEMSGKILFTNNPEEGVKIFFVKGDAPTKKPDRKAK